MVNLASVSDVHCLWFHVYLIPGGTVSSVLPPLLVSLDTPCNSIVSDIKRFFAVWVNACNFIKHELTSPCILVGRVCIDAGQIL